MPLWTKSLFLVPMLAAPAMALPNPNLPLDRPYTLLGFAPAALEAEYHRMLESDVPRSFIFPRPCRTPLDSTAACGDAAEGGWRYADSAGNRSLRLSPIGGYEYRIEGQGAHAADFGMVAAGGAGPLSFYVDARMYTEFYADLYHASYDREFVERQDENASGSIAYSSYSRYRSNLGFDWPWGRLTAARDAAHWGPGQFTNLVFNQDAVPFNQLTFTTHIGPVSVQSLYGQLSASRDWESDTGAAQKHLYAHRYEWRATRNLLLGVSEQLILYKVGAPFAFVPVIPLFITKASEKERLNNGNLAADVSLRLPGLGAVYSEFLIDDIQSPTSLFDDKWSNKWAWMAGAHWIGGAGGRRYGAISEYSHVEPWVYTHYVPHTAQTAQQDYPLGNPWGPNSQVIVAKAYFAPSSSWYLSLRNEWIWKGTDPGSDIEDIHPEPGPQGKSFLSGVGSPEYHCKPYAWYGSRRWAAYAQLDLARAVGGAVGVQARY